MNEDRNQETNVERPEREPPRVGVRIVQADPVNDELGDLDRALDAHDFPTTTSDLIADYGDYEVESRRGRRSVREVLAPIDDETYDTADHARVRIQRLLDRG